MQLTVTLNNGLEMPRLGMGTWFMGEHKSEEAEEIRALRAGMDAGMTLIDTAEMYGSGGAEAVVGKAIRDVDRDDLFLVSKVLPNNAGERYITQALNATLKRMGTDHLDLYLLHWRGMVPLSETVECMEEFVRQGKIRGWGVSNFDTADMEELWETPGGQNCLVNQDLYHLGSRGIEYDLLPWMREHNVPLMAYCPLAQAGSLRRGLVDSPAVQTVAARHGVTPMQVLLAFVLHEPLAIAIPKSASANHVLENWAAREIELSEEDFETLDSAFPAPDHKTYLDIV